MAILRLFTIKVGRFALQRFTKYALIILFFIGVVKGRRSAPRPNAYLEAIEPFIDWYLWR